MWILIAGLAIMVIVNSGSRSGVGVVESGAGQNKKPPGDPEGFLLCMYMYYITIAAAA